ncbi:MAG: hypothetical protein LBT47_09200 [Deltaproteobacteria bacterium]|jgi:hypothetical protein|nr:hypothetical protein [Deltaproteobacteria bacterium]
MCLSEKLYWSFEEPDVRQAAEIDPRQLLARVNDGAVLDEIQDCRSLFLTFKVWLTAAISAEDLF